MKIGILTYHFSDNYGALFQAYALRKWFANAGHDVSFVNYHPDYVEQGGSLNFSKPLSKENLKIVYLKAAKLKEKAFGNKEQKNNFNNFRSNVLNVSGQEYKNITDIQMDSKEYDLLVCGSDQIWKPSEHYGVDPVYFLDFAAQGKPRKISYAPSFGKDSLDSQYKNDIAQLLGKLDGISVREKTGCKIAEDLTGVEPVCVPDPTFLLDSYDDIMKDYPLESSKHVFCYALRSREGIGNFAESLAKKLDCDLYSPHNVHRRWPEIGKTVYPCPQQWLYLLNKAEFVVTNSFHGTALSILLKKPFVVVGLQGSRKVFNARVKNLLGILNLESRFLEEVHEGSVDDVLSRELNWDEVHQNVENLRNVGTDYLLDQMSHCR